MQIKYGYQITEINQKITLKKWIKYLCDVLLCFRKSWSDGPIWGRAEVPELPSRGSSCSQGGTAPTIQIEQKFTENYKVELTVKCINHSNILPHIFYKFIHCFTCMHIPTVGWVLWKNKHLWVQGDCNDGKKTQLNWVEIEHDVNDSSLSTW